MIEPPNDSRSIRRTFRDLSSEEVANIEKGSAIAPVSWTGSFGWDELLRSQRILIVSEAGAGKTFECGEQQVKLWKMGEPAFFLDLATLSTSSVRDMLSEDEEKRFDAWLLSQSEIATFFLDSIDELKLTLAKFDHALKRLNKALKGQLGRTRIVITTRPVPIDQDTIKRHLPIPVAREAKPTAEAFADMVMDRSKKLPSENAEQKPWRVVGLMPLSLAQMRQFAELQGVMDPDALVADIQQRDAEEFAERPQDLVELCADWREHHRIRSHREQVETNIETKLKPSTERKERAELSQQTAIEGASRLALAAMLTRKLTLRHSANSDSVHATGAALDVSKILQDWSAEAIATLLERPLFGFASYGRVRFHQLSVVEFLAAKRLDALLARGVSIKSVKRLLFTQTANGVRAVRPSMRPVSAWLALSRDTVFDSIVAVDPAVVLDHGDPQSFRPLHRVRALEAYVDRFRYGGWRGLNIPRIQVHRFASTELTDAVKQLWDQRIENQEVRNLLLQLISAGKLVGCANIAHSTALDVSLTVRERSLAVEALLKLKDSRLEAISLSVENDHNSWPNELTRHAMIAFFPAYMPVSRLSQILQRVKEKPRSIGALNYRLPREINIAEMSPEYLDQLRQALTDLIVSSISWERDKSLRDCSKRSDLIPALTATCRRQAAAGIRTEAWITSSLLAIRLSAREASEKDALKELHSALAELDAEAREVAFWKEDAFLENLHQTRDSWQRVIRDSEHGGIKLNDEKDAGWIRKLLANTNEPLERREMMLWCEMILLNRSTIDYQGLLENLIQFVADSASLTAIINVRLKPQEHSAKFRRMEAASAKRSKQAERRAAKAYTSWVTFWREIVTNPDSVFTTDRAEGTAWNLWQAVERSGKQSRASGWNRRFLEEQFSKTIADRVREIMMALWRKDRPSLRSERSVGEKATFLVKWQFGLAGIAAEAEDTTWAQRLTEDEAELACRYAPIEMNGFPFWLESLAIEHPSAIDRILGEELSLSLDELTDANSYSDFLQSISHASAIVATLFVPRIRTWLSQSKQLDISSNNPQSKQNLRHAIEILLKSRNDDDRRSLEMIARQRLAKVPVSNAPIWLHALLNLDANAGVEALEARLKGIEVSKISEGVKLFSQLFGREHGRAGIDLRSPEFTPKLLLRLLQLAYSHVRIEDDARHEGTYSPDTRDDAESARDAVFSALLSTTGPEGWAAKLEMASDPLFHQFKDRVLALAQEKAAEEADNVPLTEADFAILDRTGESPPMTREAMFALMSDRLDDIDDLLLQDISPRELWATIKDEHVMRKTLAHVLRDAGNQCYTIDQEAVTADEKETDIRFRSTRSGQQGTIELKLGDQRSGADLFNTIRDQLLTKYMAADECRAGYLLVTIAKHRKWEHPKTGEKVSFEELIAVLNEEATLISTELGGTAKLGVKGLDLRSRLGTEKSHANA